MLGSVPDMNRSDTESAIKTAYVAFQSWKERTAKVTQFGFFVPFFRKCVILVRYKADYKKG